MEKYDDLERYCPRLGHYLTFNYCRTVNSDLPCSKVLDCWFEKIEIQEFVNNNYQKEEIEKIFSTPKQKVSSILELIEKAKNRK